MTKSKDDTVIYRDFDKRLILETEQPVSELQLDLAKILVQLNYIYTVVNECRNKPEITKLYKYKDIKKNNDFENETAIYGATKIVNHYNLSSEWVRSFYFAILTNTLPVPNENGIQVLLPKSFSHGLGGLANNLSRDSVADKDTILIEIPKQMSLDSVRKFLEINKESLNEHLERLSGIKTPRRELGVMFVGQAAWLVRKDEPDATWGEILEALKKIWETLDIQEPNLPDTYVELQIYYSRYIATLKSLEN